MFSTLTALKAFVLPEPVQSRDDYDDALQEIGSGVAARFDTLADRKLLRAVGDSVIFSGDRMVYVLPRYPVEEIASLQYRADYSSDWSDDSERIDQLSMHSGLLTLDRAGTEKSQVRVNFTGGYWVDLTGSDSLPEGATAMPADLRLAWLRQCKHIFDVADKDGDSFRSPDRGLGGALVSLLQMDLLPEVESTVKAYKRYQII